MIRCAIAGYGRWGQTVSRRLQGSARLAVAYIVEPDAERRRGRARQTESVVRL